MTRPNIFHQLGLSTLIFSICAFAATLLPNVTGAEENRGTGQYPRIVDTSQKKLLDARSTNLTSDTPHTLVGSYYTTQGGVRAKLLLNNKGINPLEIRPKLYSLSGQSLELAPVFVEPRSFRFIDLQEWADLGGEAFQSGSVELFHTGLDLVLGAQVYLTDEKKGLSFEEKLAELGKFDSRRQEAVWFQPPGKTEMRVVLSNKSEQLLTVTGRLSGARDHLGDINSFQLAGHETRILDLRRDFSDGRQVANADVAGLSLEHTGGADALQTRVLIADSERGYSNFAQFSNPNGGKSSEYQGVGFRIDEIEGRKLTPVIVVT